MPGGSRRMKRLPVYFTNGIPGLAGGSVRVPLIESAQAKPDGL